MTDILKQAIVDARALRASATAIAKATIQEAFEPKVKEMVDKAIKESDEEVNEEKLGTDGPEDKKDPKDKETKLGPKKGTYKGSRKESDYDKQDPEGPLEEELTDMEDVAAIGESDEMDESSLDEILAELDGMDEDDEEGETEEGEDHDGEAQYEAAEEGSEEAEAEEGEDEDGDDDDEDEEIVLTFGQLKQALAPYMGGEEGEEGSEEDDDADVDLDEILATEEKLGTDGPEDSHNPKDKEPRKKTGSWKDSESESDYDEADPNGPLEEEKEDLEELRATLNEVNLLNAKLLYMNKIFKAKSLSESQKRSVVGAFDRAKSVKEVKNTYLTLKESIETKTRKTQLRESFGFASKASGVAQKANILESDPYITRMQQLAGITKKKY